MPPAHPAHSTQRWQMAEPNIKAFPAQTTISCKELGIHQKADSQETLSMKCREDLVAESCKDAYIFLKKH